MQEAYDLLCRASALRQLDQDAEQINGGPSEYKMRLDDGDGALWVYLNADSRADAVWAAYTLARACSDQFDYFDLWGGTNHVLGDSTKAASVLLDTPEEVNLTTQLSLLSYEETILSSKMSLRPHQKLLKATEELRKRLPARDSSRIPRMQSTGE